MPKKNAKYAAMMRSTAVELMMKADHCLEIGKEFGERAHNIIHCAEVLAHWADELDQAKSADKRPRSATKDR